TSHSRLQNFTRHNHPLCVLKPSFTLPSPDPHRSPVLFHVYRHGDRSPVKSYPNDPYQESAWPQGFGQLSQKGMQQHLKLGQNLRQRYQDLLNMTYNRHEIFVRSTDYDRTLMSAEVNLAGMYPPNGSQVFDPNVHWQPIPVHAVPQDKDQLLLFPMSGCPRYEALMNETRKSEVFKNMSSTYKDFLEMVQNKTGLKDANMESVWSVHDTLFCEQMHNMTLPPWVTPDVMEKLGILKDFSFQVMFGVYKSEEKCRLQGGVLLNQITKNISASAVTKNQQLKMIVYSAHDTTVVALQSALKVFSGKQPTYASCHMFELFREDNGSFSVAMFYWNDSSTEPYPLILPGCVQYCPLEEFIRLTKPVIPVDWKQECQVPSGSKDTGNFCHIQHLVHIVESSLWANASLIFIARPFFFLSPSVGLNCQLPKKLLKKIT
uniref:Lysosomal acid phosphatase n=1 Tax=Scleropages formosus TaxID=113540 RepID=A0A8D0CGN9_SCLFO